MGPSLARFRPRWYLRQPPEIIATTAEPEGLFNRVWTLLALNDPLPPPRYSLALLFSTHNPPVSLLDLYPF